MNILIDVRCLMNSQYSGVAEYTFHLLEALFKIDTKNQYFLFYNCSSQPKMPAWQQDNIHWLKYNYPNKLFNSAIHFLNYPKLSQLVKEKIDLYFLPNLNFAAFGDNDKIILTIHDLSFDLYPQFFSTKRRLWHKIINPSDLCKQVNHLIAVSQNTKDDLCQHYQIDPTRIKVIHPGINAEFIKMTDDPNLQKIKNKYDLPERFLFFLATIEPRKNIIGLLSAYEILRDKYGHNIPLIIAGGNGWLYKKIYKKAAQSKYSRNIKFIGYVDKEDKAALYNLASIFMFPSFYEGFGFPPLEAIFCQTPVVASYTGSLSEVLGEYALLVDPYNCAEIAMACDQILHQQWKIPDTAGLKEHYAWQTAAQNTLNLFQEI